MTLPHETTKLLCARMQATPLRNMAAFVDREQVKRKQPESLTMFLSYFNANLWCFKRADAESKIRLHPSVRI